MPSTFTTRTTCRICASSLLKHVLSLGHHFVNNFVPPGQAYVGEACPIELVECQYCSLVQNPHTAPQELLYSGHYWYKSGTTDTMRKALADVVKAATSQVDLHTGDVVLDIGSNDGTLLRHYCPALFRVGVEPATNMRGVGSGGIDLFINSFWTAENYFSAMENTVRALIPKAKVITAIGMFYDLEDPNQFIADIAKALHRDGVFIAQLMCLQNMLNVGDIGNLAHEHLEFYTLRSLEYMLNAHGLELYDIETNTVNGESYRLFIQHRMGSRQTSYRVAEARNAENRISDRLYDFWKAVEANKRKVVDFIRDAKRLGKKIWVYGASTKGNTILQYYQLGPWDIVGAAERDPDKWGKVMIGSNVPIYSEEVARNAKCDYFLVLPFAFINEFVQREQAFITRGGKFIVPLPEMRII